MNTVEADGMSSRDQNEVRAATDKLRIVVIQLQGGGF
jgi:hypothetical protein